PRAFPPVHTPRRRPALEQRGAVHPSAELLELRTLGLHVIVLLAGRSRGLRVRHPLHFALRRSGDREAGGGARAPKAAAKRLPLRRRPAQAVAALPCPSPRHRPVVRASSANGVDRIRRPAGSGWKSPPPIQGCPGLDAGVGGPRGSGGGRPNPLGRRWPRPLSRSRASVAGTDL